MSATRAVLLRLATSARLERAVRAVPAGERYARRAASGYVAGTTFADAVGVVRELDQRGVSSSLDQFGEQVRCAATAERVAADYADLARQLTGLPASVWLSVDLSHLGLDIDPARCSQRLIEIAAALPEGRRVQVGAEDHDRADAVLGCITAVVESGLADRIGATVQANLRRSPSDLERHVEAGVHVRLVKGAYREPPDRALPYGEDTDVAYLRLAHRLAEAGAQFSLATHDGVLREALLAALGPRPIEQLLGVRPANLDELVARHVPVRVYVPFGENWFRYWMRRVAESAGRRR